MSLARADAASIVLCVGNVARVIAHKNLEFGNASFEWSWDKASFAPRATIIQHGAEANAHLRMLSLITGRSTIATFMRKSLLVEDGYSAAMHLYSFENELRLSNAEKAIWEAIARQQKQIISAFALSFLKTGSLVTIPATLQEMIEATNSFAGFRALFDSELKYVAVSQPWADRRNVTPAQLIGKTYQDKSSLFSDIMTQLGRRALSSGISIPDIEFSREYKGEMRHYVLLCSPIRPFDAPADMLDAHVKELPAENYYTPEDKSQVAAAAGAQHMGDATQQFLFETLIKKRSIRMRDGVSYITVRSWRESIKKHQILALKACKRAGLPTLAFAAGKECAEEIVKLVGATAFKFVVPVPCGHSPEEKCLSMQLAKAIANRLNLPVVQAFSHLKQKGTSHPKENLKREKMLQIREVPGPAILVDDVATSGVHLGEASNILKANGTDSFAIAWIGGDRDE